MIVVLGCHGGGTSLVAGLLHSIGVDMHYNPHMKIRTDGKTYLNYEDSHFVRLNCSLLHCAGGNWRYPPKPEDLDPNNNLKERMQALIAERESHYRYDFFTWGFKDPRTAITVRMWHELLPQPEYVFVHREPKDAANSIALRGKHRDSFEKYLETTNGYYDSITDFIESYDVEYLSIAYEDFLTHSEESINRLAKFVKAEKFNLPEALALIRK